MSKNMVAKAKTSIGATKSRVWEALVTPDAIKQYMFGADVESDSRQQLRRTGAQRIGEELGSDA